MNDKTYSLDDVIITQKEYKPHDNPIDWIAPGSVPAVKEDKKDVVPEGYDPGVATPDSTHIKVGKSLAEFGVQLRERDSDGLKPGAHGSAWIAEEDAWEKLQAGLLKMGYRAKGKGKFVRGPVMIEVGRRDGKLYLYISDDNGLKVIVPGGKKESKAIVKMEEGEDHPAEHYLVVENPFKPTTWRLPVYDKDGKLDHGLMGAAWAALHGGYRGNKYEGPAKRDALAKLKKLYAAEKMELPK